MSGCTRAIRASTSCFCALSRNPGTILKAAFLAQRPAICALATDAADQGHERDSPPVAKSLDELIDQLKEALAEHNPPNSYADALAKSYRLGEEFEETRSVLRRRPLRDRFPKSMHQHMVAKEGTGEAASNGNTGGTSGEDRRVRGYKEFMSRIVSPRDIMNVVFRQAKKDAQQGNVGKRPYSTESVRRALNDKGAAKRPNDNTAAQQNVYNESTMETISPGIQAVITLDIGDIVEIRKSRSIPSLSAITSHISLGVVVKRTSGRFAYLVCLSNGETVGISTESVGFRARKYAIRKAALQSAGLSLEEVEQVHAWAETHNNIRVGSIGRSVEEDPAYELLVTMAPRILEDFRANSDELQWSVLQKLEGYWESAIKRDNMRVTTSRLARITFGKKPSPTMMFAVYSYLINNTISYVPDFNWLHITGGFTLRPPEEIRRFERVLGWARSKFPEITGFWTKARKLIAYSLIGDKDDEKSLQSVTGLVPECELPLDRQDILTIEFSDSDKDIIQIIRCFISYHGSGYRQVDNPYQVVVPLILKPLRVYGDIDVDAATQFLVDIGAWPKWQNLNLYDIRVPIEGMEVNPAVDQDAMDCQRLAEQFLRDRDNMAAAATAAAASPLIQDRTNVATSLGPDDFMPYDDVEKYREDLSDMLVYTIDDEATMDIDDGVSFERVVATDGSVKEWVHIHVADPTRYIHANHRFAQFAQHRVTSLYPPERTYHMLPKQFSIEVASIKARRDGGLVPALTFSAVIRKDGTIEDFKFRPSYIRNIRRCTYNEVDDAIASASGNELHSEDVATFKHLCAIAQRHREDRIRTGAFHHDLPMFKVGLSKSGALPQFPQVPSTPQFLLPVASEAGLDRLPDIHISKVDLETPSQAMVSELMIVAGRVATRFAHAHNITLPFRTQESPACDNYEFGEIEIPTALPNLSPADARNAKAILRAVMEQVDPHTGLVKTAYYDEIRYMMNPAILSANPGPHFSVGINDQFGYARVTSPIRRYVDLLSHWQLKSALYKKIMFSRKTLESLIPKLLRAELVCKQIGKNSYFTWAMFKAAEDLKRNPDQIFTGLVATRDATRPYIVAVVDGYGFHCMVQSRPSDPAELPIAGTPIKIRLTEILPHQNLASAEWVTV